MMRLIPFAKHVASWLALAGCTLASHAGGLSVNPIRIDLSEGTPTAAITLRNSGGTAMVLQLQMTKWSVVQGEDQYESTDDLLITPPVFSIAAGASQVVRVGLGSAPNAQLEAAYRLFIEEVPPPQKEGYQGLQVALRIGVPAFVRPARAATPMLKWTAERSGADVLVIRATNIGNAHDRVIALALRAPGQEQVLATQTAASYLLPGQNRTWTLRLENPWPGQRVRLAATTEAGVANADLELQTP